MSGSTGGGVGSDADALRSLLFLTVFTLSGLVAAGAAARLERRLESELERCVDCGVAFDSRSTGTFGVDADRRRMWGTPTTGAAERFGSVCIYRTGTGKHIPHLCQQIDFLEKIFSV